MGWKDGYRNDLVKWQTLLHEWTRKDLAFVTGTAFSEVVLKCLQSDVIDSDTKREKERVRDFCWEIVRTLEGLKA